MIRTYKSIALVLAGLLLVSTAGLSLDMHLCQGHAKTFNLLGKARDCQEMARKVASSHCQKLLNLNHGPHLATETSACKKGCCEQKLLIFQLHTDASPVVFGLDETTQVWAVLTVAPFTTEKSNQADYRLPPLNGPPLFQRDLPVLYQSFLL